jgi:hypothetical protein
MMGDHQFGDATQWDKDLLLGWFMNHLKWEERQIIMREFPGAYNRMCGEEIVKVFRSIDLDAAAMKLVGSKQL